MRVLIWPAGDDASAWYRLKFPAFELASQGVDVVIASGQGAGPKVAWDRDWSHLSSPPYEARAMALAERPDADVVVINRPGRAHWAEVIPMLQAQGVRVVVDVDDDFDAIPVGNAARQGYRHPRCNGDWMRRACLLADLVTCTTPDLARKYAPHGRVAVLPNLVPAHYLDIEPSEPLERTIGWSGSVDTHPGDLETVGSAVADVVGAHDGWRVHVVGTGKGVPERLRVTGPSSSGRKQVTATGQWLPFAAYPLEMARLAVGIVPLQSSRFNRSKSALKMAEFSALGVPVVASPTPDNLRLHGHGVGLVVKTPREWAQHLTRLVEDDDFRADCAHTSREAMRGHTYEQWADLWACAWESTLKRKAVA